MAALVACIGFVTAQISIDSIDAIKENVVLKNDNSTDINLAGWILSDVGNHSFTLPNFVLSAGEKVTINSKTGNETGVIYLGSSARGIWNNDHDSATLADSQGNVISTKSY